MTVEPERPSIHVLAGPNGAGKSSVGGRSLRSVGQEHFDPDEHTREIIRALPGIDPGEANALSWHQMVGRLRQAIAERRSFTFETTLGGSTITHLLGDAAPHLDVSIWYLALASAEHHVERVRQRAASGGHDIPVEKIRARYDSSRLHLVQLLPVLAELYVFDNTEPPLPHHAIAEPRLILHVRRGVIEECVALPDVPQWAKAIVMASIELDAAARLRPPS